MKKALWLAVFLAVLAAGCTSGGKADGGGGDDAADASFDDAQDGSCPSDASDDAAADAGFDAGFDWDANLCRTVITTPDAGLGWPFYLNRTLDGGVFTGTPDDAGKFQATVAGNRMMSVDLNNDDYPDLIVHRVSGNNRDEPASDDIKKKNKFIMRNMFASGGKFEDVTIDSRYGMRRDDNNEVNRSSHFAIAADVNNDGNVDLFSGRYTDSSQPDDGDRSEILFGDGKGHFTLGPEVPIYRDLGEVTSATFLDYNRDGCIDIFVGAFYVNWTFPANPDRLYKGDCTGNFTEVTDDMGLMTDDSTWPDSWETGVSSKPTYGVTSCDINGDGDTDILTSSYGREWNFLWLRNGDKFREVGKETHYAGDDLLDYSDNQFYKCYCYNNPGTCNPDPGKPSITCGNYWDPDSDGKPWRLNGNTFTTVCADVDNDLRPDVYHTEIRHWHIGKSSDQSQLLLNKTAVDDIGFTFQRVDQKAAGMERIWGSGWNEGDISAAIFDFDNDGLPDIFLACSDYPYDRDFMFWQQPDHTFKEMAKYLGIAHDRGQEVTVADYDRDGDLDLVVGTSLMRYAATDKPPPPKDAWVHFYENMMGNLKNSIEIKLVGAGKKGLANKSAIGARITVTTPDGKKQMREVQGGYGHFGLQNDLVQHFGVGENCTISEIEVRWPDQNLTVEIFTNVRANALVEIEQGNGFVKYVLPLIRKEP